MTTDPLDDAVARQYRRWVYPEPIEDLPGWLAGNWQWFDPSHAQRLLWPDRAEPRDLDVLVAGCGANQAAVLAYTNPGSRIVGVDVSEPSLDHHRRLAERYRLDNLELELLPIEDVGSLGRDFDLVVSTGVLHHLADPAAGMAALARCLRPDGVAAIMLYARYGRIGVEMLQGAFRDLGLEQDEPSLALVQEALAALPADHPLQPYLELAPDLAYDAGLVDTFLHGRDRSYTTGECVELVTGAGLVFDDWFLQAPYAPPDPATPLGAAVAALPRAAQWSVMERIHPRNGCHFFTACRPERDPATYRIDLDGPGLADLVPFLRHRCTLAGGAVGRADWSTPIDGTQYALLRLVDGHRSIGEILAEGAAGTDFEARDAAGRLDYARALFGSLWQLDVLGLAIRRD
ncbi:MAG: class I SAM-dependent methyltransferase [Actinomycetota bacterium]